MGNSTPRDWASLQHALAERLHDGPLQDLVALELHTARLAELAAGSTPALEARVREIKLLARAVIEELQRIVADFALEDVRPPPLHERLAALAAEFRAQSGIECRISGATRELGLEPAVGEIVFRAVRELLANARKHSNATRVELEVRRAEDGSVAITVADNGVGIAPAARRRSPFAGGGFGLWSIEHRLAEVGGTLVLETDGGVRATIVVPAARRV